jgi:membrane protein required for colicin V production
MLLYNPRRADGPRPRRAAVNSTDYVVIAAILISAIVGAARGFLREAIAVGAWIIALFLAWHFSELLAPHLGGLLSYPQVQPWAARVIIVVLVLLFGAALGSILGQYVRLSIFSGMDRFLGLFFGLLRGFVLLGLFVILAQLLQLQDERWWRQSMLIPYGESIANGLRVLVGEPRQPRTERVRT